MPVTIELGSDSGKKATSSLPLPIAVARSTMPGPAPADPRVVRRVRVSVRARRPLRVDRGHGGVRPCRVDAALTLVEVTESYARPVQTLSTAGALAAVVTQVIERESVRQGPPRDDPRSTMCGDRPPMLR